MRSVILLLLVAVISVPGPAAAATSLWWDTAWDGRYNVDVATGPVSPDKGYAGYTARIAPLDTQSLVASGDLQSDCRDLRLLYYDGLGWQELPRHVIGCNTATTDIRFALAADIPASASDDNYYLYYGNPAAGAPAGLSPTNVYLWFDDAATDRSGSYVRGRIDNWHGDGWDDSLSWNPAGYYQYDNGDNFTSGYRRAIDERDVYIEAEFFHTGCYQFNKTSGVLVRGIIASGTLGSETSDHYYASNRGQFPGCRASGYTHDGDILEDQRTTTVVDGPDPPPITANTWRRQALAAWSTTPTNLAFWDEDSSALWAATGFPAGSNLQASGTDVSDNTGRGFVAIMTAQDDARVRNIVVRRFVSPEPVLTLTDERQPPSLLLQKALDTVFDPVNGATSPKAIPGSYVEYTITATNSGAGSADPDSVVVTDPLPPGVALFVGDLGAPGSGPVVFDDGSGAAASGLAYSWGGPGDLSDSVDFSLDGNNWNYVPTPDADGFDAAVRHVRVRPTGSFEGATGATPTQFSIRIRVKVL